MDHWNTLSLMVATFIGCVYAPDPYPCNAPSLHVWPLGPTMQDLDIITGSGGTLGNVASGSFQPAVDYNSTGFLGTLDSSITLTVEAYTPIDSNDDYAFQCYVKFENITRGTIFTVESNSVIPDAITKFRLEIVNGDLMVNVTDYGQGTVAVGLVAGIWYHIVLMRDKNQEFFAILLNHNKAKKEAHIHKDIADVPTLFPATVVVGQDTDDVNPLRGEMSCLQFVPCKSPFEATYDANCIPAAWPTTTSTTTVATTTATGVTTTTTTAEDFIVAETCMRYTLLANDAVFEFTEDILDTPGGVSTSDCARKCSSNHPCEAFAFDGSICTLGLNGTSIYGVGSDFYILI